MVAVVVVWMRTVCVTCASLLALTGVAAANEVVATVRVDVQLRADRNASFRVDVHPDWAPLGAARFLDLVDEGGDAYWHGMRFFRVVPNFMAQFGIPTTPAAAAEWEDRRLADDPVVAPNRRGYVSFATSGADSRTTQLFINFGDNRRLDALGFAPFAVVTGRGMDDVVDQIYDGYGEQPDQGRIHSEGNVYLETAFPELSYITSIQRVSTPPTASLESNPIVCPDGQDPTPDTFCGRGTTRVDCASDEFCFVEPTDRFAVCCPTPEIEMKCCDPEVGPGGCPDENGSFDNCWEEGGFCCSDGEWYANDGGGGNNCADNQLEDSQACPASVSDAVIPDVVNNDLADASSKSDPTTPDIMASGGISNIGGGATLFYFTGCGVYLAAIACM